MNSLAVLLAALGVLVAGQQGGFGGGFGGQAGMGGQMGGHGGPGGKVPGGPPPPPFLANVTEEARQAFFQIVKDQNQTKAAIKTAVESWATTYGVSDAVTAFEAELESMKTARRANVTEAVGQLSAAISQLNAIEDNQDLTPAQTMEQIKTDVDAMSPELRALVMAAGPKPPMGPGGPKGPEGGMGGFGGMGGQQGGRGGNRGGF